MPHSSHTQQTKTHEAAASYSPRLCNEDLAPTRDQNWSWYNIFSFWMSDVHSMGGYVVAASFFTLGLASWQVLLCLLVGICIVQLCANLVAKPSQMAGVPYAVICRQAFGVFGANIPAVIRGLIAFAWYGIQTYLAANALMLVLLKFWPSLASLTSSSFLGLSTLGWLCFATMWLLQAMVFWHGMNAIKRFIDIAGPAVYVVMLALAGWIVYKTGLDGISFTLASKSLSAGEQTWQMITATALVVSYFSGPLLNFGDFSRYGKSMGEIRRGNRWGLPFNFLLFSVVTVVIVSGTQSLFGKMITDPIETVSRVGNDLAVAIGLHNLPEGLAVALPVLYATKSRGRAFLAALASGFAEPAGALLAFGVLGGRITASLVTGMAALVCGVMCWVSVAELLPTGLSLGRKEVTAAGFGAGLLAMTLGIALLS